MKITSVWLTFLACLGFSSHTYLLGQTILQQSTIERIESSFPHYEWLNKDPDGGYLLAIGKNSTESLGLVVDSVLIPTFHYAEDNNSFLHDFFLCKVRPDFSVSESFVIDNAEYGRDVYCGEEYVLYSMSIVETSANTDSFPILMNGEIEISRENRWGTGVVVVLNDSLEYVNHFFPSTGEIGQVAVDGHMAYLELRIPDYVPYIIVNGIDTVYNQQRPPPSTSYGRQTVVLCKYNLLSNQVEWLLRIGGAGFEELSEMQIDQEHNLVVLGHTSTIHFTFSESDTVVNSSADNPFLAKYNSNGDFISGILNQHRVVETASDFYIDEENNYYIISFYAGIDYKVQDTILHNTLHNNQYGSRGLVRKYNNSAEFQWAQQLEGKYYQSHIHGISKIKDEIVISGIFTDGTLYLDQDTFYHAIGSGLEYGFLLMLNENNGSISNYIMTQGNYHRRFIQLYKDDFGNLDMFMRYRGEDTIFNVIFDTNPSFYNGYLIKLSLEPNTTSTLSKPANLFNLAPNPVNNSGFNLYPSLTGDTQILSYTIFDSNGHVSLMGSMSSSTGQFIATHNWPPGIYWVKVQTQEQVQIQPIVIL